MNLAFHGKFNTIYSGIAILLLLYAVRKKEKNGYDKRN